MSGERRGGGRGEGEGEGGGDGEGRENGIMRIYTALESSLMSLQVTFKRQKLLFYHCFMC